MSVVITIENMQIIDKDTLRLDLLFTGLVSQDGKKMELKGVRDTIYVRGESASADVDTGNGHRAMHDPRQKPRL